MTLPLDDCKKLWKDYGVNVRNCIDLGLLARTVDNAHWKGKYSSPIGLARLCETYHELSLAKGKVQRSNWEANLSTLQQDCKLPTEITPNILVLNSYSQTPQTTATQA